VYYGGGRRGSGGGTDCLSPLVPYSLQRQEKFLLWGGKVDPFSRPRGLREVFLPCQRGRILTS